MAINIQAVKGTQDALPRDSYKLRFLEQEIEEIASNYGFSEIRTPVFEYTDLFCRSVGDTTDVVQKEMYTFEDKGGRSITLRPEGTAGAMRSFLEHGLFNEGLPQKVFYFTSCYRYEKPQAGRLREFHQFGIECFGTESPAADAEAISLASEIFGFLGIEDIVLELNSIGCPTCRAEYHKALKEYFEGKKSDLCNTCIDRLERNPMRILDCKSPVCSDIAKDAPTVINYLCDDCREHFESVKKYLDAMDIDYKINPTIVRGLDYYTRTVFEFVSTKIGAQGTVLGGGRYDGLAEQLGGARTPYLGFAMGMERLMLVLEAQGVELPQDNKCNLYIAPVGEEASLLAAKIVTDLRCEGIFAMFDVVGRSIKAQMKYANKIGAEFTIVLGDDELKSGVAQLKNMDDGETQEIKVDKIAEDFASISIQAAVGKLSEDSFDGIDLNALLGGSI
ncbi:MAG: histidine--tRNA ligase [Oscillospiraceae bacterium]